MVGHAQPSVAHLVAILHSQLRSMRPLACYAWHAACIFSTGPFCEWYRRCTQWDQRTVRQRIMPYFPQATIVRSTTGRNGVAAHVPLRSIVHNAISTARVIGTPPPEWRCQCCHFS